MTQKLVKSKSVSLEPYRLHLLHDTSLTGKQHKMLSQYRRANALMCAGYSLEQTVLIIRKESQEQREKPLSESHAYKICREAVAIYGSVKTADVAGLKHIMYENFMLASGLARKQGDFAAMIRALENAAKVYNLFAPEMANIDIDDFRLKRTFVYTDSEELLRAQADQIMKRLEGGED